MGQSHVSKQAVDCVTSMNPKTKECGSALCNLESPSETELFAGLIRTCSKEFSFKAAFQVTQKQQNMHCDGLPNPSALCVGYGAPHIAALPTLTPIHLAFIHAKPPLRQTGPPPLSPTSTQSSNPHPPLPLLPLFKPMLKHEHRGLTVCAR